MKMDWRVLGLKTLALAPALCAGMAHAPKVVGDWTPVFQGVGYMTGYETDVQYPGVQLIV